MKKLNKKWLIGISSLSIGIGVVSSPIIASKINYNSKNINEYKDNLNTKIDYNLVESLLF